MLTAHIIFGYHLNKPVDAVITWYELDNFDQSKGGTAMALKMVMERQIPVFNLYLPNKNEILNQIAKFIKQKGANKKPHILWGKSLFRLIFSQTFWH